VTQARSAALVSPSADGVFAFQPMLLPAELLTSSSQPVSLRLRLLLQAGGPDQLLPSAVLAQAAEPVGDTGPMDGQALLQADGERIMQLVLQHPAAASDGLDADRPAGRLTARVHAICCPTMAATVASAASPSSSSARGSPLQALLSLPPSLLSDPATLLRLRLHVSGFGRKKGSLFSGAPKAHLQLVVWALRDEPAEAHEQELTEFFHSGSAAERAAASLTASSRALGALLDAMGPVTAPPAISSSQEPVPLFSSSSAAGVSAAACVAPSVWRPLARTEVAWDTQPNGEAHFQLLSIPLVQVMHQAVAAGKHDLAAAGLREHTPLMLQLLLVDPKKLSATGPATGDSAALSSAPAPPLAACEELARVSTTLALLLDKQFVVSGGAGAITPASAPRKGDPHVHECPAASEAMAAKAVTPALGTMFATDVAVFVAIEAAQRAMSEPALGSQ